MVIAVVIMIAAIALWLIAPATGRSFKELPIILIFSFFVGVGTLMHARNSLSTLTKKKEEK